jgi:AcrR family transcriptional regulator
MHRELTAKGKATRDRIVDGAATVIRELGVGVATLDDVMARTRTSNSQLFHYFPDGKDQLSLPSRGSKPIRCWKTSSLILLATGESSHLKAALDQGITGLRRA